MKLSIKIFFLSGFIFLSGCKKEQPIVSEVAEDPCSNAQYVTADFDILEILLPTGNWEPYIQIPTDKVLSNKNVKFLPKFKGADRYTWYVGTEVLHDDSVTRYFDQSLEGQQITISLAVESKTNAYCLPDDDGYDSISKTFDVVAWCDTNIMEGYFRVAIEGTTDSVDVGFDIYYGIWGSSTHCTDVDVYNYNLLGDTMFNSNLGRTYRTYRWVGLEGTSAINPYDSFYYQAQLDLDGTYHLWVSKGNPQFYYPRDPFPQVYVGRKL